MITAIDSVLFQEGKGDLWRGCAIREIAVESFGERCKYLWNGVVEWL